MEPINLLGKPAWYLAYRVPSNLTRWVRKVISRQVQGLQAILGTSKREVNPNTVDPSTTQGLGVPTPPLYPLTHSQKSAYLQSALCTHSSASTDSTSHGRCSTAVHVYWKSVCKWTHAVQVHVVQGSTVHSYCKRNLMVSPWFGFLVSRGF